MMKRFTAVIVSAFLIFSFCVSSQAAAPDATGNKYESAIDFVTAFGFMSNNDDGSFGIDETVSRASFASVIFNMMGLDFFDSEDGGFGAGDYTGFGKDDWKNMGYEEQEEIPQNAYSDIPLNFWAEDAVKFCVQFDFMSLFSDGTFRPNESITNIQAFKALVKILGYEPRVNALGTDIINYVTVANSIGILNGVSVSYNDPLKKDVFARLVYNSLGTDLFEMTAVGAEVSYQKTTGKNLLTQRHKIYKLNGRVNANEITSIDGRTVPNKKHVIIDNERYQTGRTDASDMLGYYVTFYYRQLDNDNIKTIVYITKRDFNETLTIDANDIIDFQNKTLTYYKGDKVRSVTVSGSVSVIYNGKLSSNVTADKFKPLNGNITFIGDGSNYDLVIINSYKTMIAGYVDKDKKIIYDKLVAGNKIELDDDSLIYKNGMAASISDINEFCVISYTDADPINHFYTLYLSTRTARGTVSSKIGRAHV